MSDKKLVGGVQPLSHPNVEPKSSIPIGAKVEINP
jgi:hypothetical protein